MAIPDFQSIMLPLLELAKDGKDHPLSEAGEMVASLFKLSEQEKSQLLPSGTQRTLDNRIAWARSYLKQAGLLINPGRGLFRITSRGQQVLESSPPLINIQFLAQFKEFETFRNNSKQGKKQSVTKIKTSDSSQNNNKQAKRAVSLKKMAMAHEEEIKTFFERLEFEHVDGARDTFKIGGIQVDACAGHEETLIVAECKLQEDPGKIDLRERILKFRGGFDLLKKGCSEHEKYKKYNRFKFVIFAKNSEIKPKDYELANKGPDYIFIATDEFIDYYKDLESKIGEFAKYNMLGELNIRPVSQLPFSTPASKMEIDGLEVFLFFANPRRLLETSYVARRRKDAEKFYQRTIVKKKLDQIAKYVNDGHILPNNIILAFDKDCSNEIQFDDIEIKSHEFKFQLDRIGTKFGFLKFPKSYRACRVIDGQHRMYSFANVDKNIPVPVVAFKNLDNEKQMEIFLDINKNQKRVPPALVWDLNGDLIPHHIDGFISQITKSLNQNGPLAGQIYIPSMGFRKVKDQLTINGICISLKNSKLAEEYLATKNARNPLYSTDRDKFKIGITKSLNLFLSSLKKSIYEDWAKGKKGFILTDGGMSILIRFYENVVERFSDKPGMPSEINFLTYLNAIRPRILNHSDKLKKRTAGEGPRRGVLIDFVMDVRNKTGDKYFGGEITFPGVHEAAILEGRLALMIKKKFFVQGDIDWLQPLLPPEVYGKAKKRALEKNKTRLEDILQKLSFGEKVRIIEDKADKFISIFVNSGESSFSSMNDLITSLRQMARYRNEDAHPEDFLDYNFKKFTLGLEQVNRCLDQAGIPSTYDEENDDEQE